MFTTADVLAMYGEDTRPSVPVEDKADEVVDKLKDLKKEGHNAYVEEPST